MHYPTDRIAHTTAFVTTSRGALSRTSLPYYALVVNKIVLTLNRAFVDGNKITMI